MWPYEGKDKVDLLVPPQDGKKPSYSTAKILLLSMLVREVFKKKREKKAKMCFRLFKVIKDKLVFR